MSKGYYVTTKKPEKPDQPEEGFYAVCYLTKEDIMQNNGNLMPLINAAMETCRLTMEDALTERGYTLGNA